MDLSRERIRDDLRGLVKGDVLADAVHLQIYASDASLHQVRPAAVMRPRNTADVVACLKYASENNVPVHARGAGTGLAGESLGPGIVIDFSRYMRRVLNYDGNSVEVQPGVVHAQLNAHLRQSGMHFGPDPATSHVTTMGGVVSVDSGGSHWLRYGSARRHVQKLTIVLADGTVMDVGMEPADDHGLVEPTPKQDLVRRLAILLTRDADLIRNSQPRSAVNRCGYQLADVLKGDVLDVAKIIAGSAGTLAMITSITVGVQPLPKHTGIALLLFDRLENAAKAVMEVLPTTPSACDLMDRRHLSLARESAVHFDLLIPPETEGALLVEYEADHPSEVRDKLNLLIDRVKRRKRLAFQAMIAQDRDEVDLYWRLAQGVTPTLHRLKGSTRPAPFIEDFAVPPAELPSFLPKMQNVLKQHQVTASLFGHAGQGQLHLRPFLDLTNPADVARMAPLATDMYREVIGVGGTISGEHGDGFSRTSFIRMQYGQLANVFREVKHIFDPKNLLNPGKVVSDDLDGLTKHLRPQFQASIAEPLNGDGANTEIPEGPARPFVKLQLAWPREQLAANVRDCNGCGACRSQLPDVRMCPIFRYAPAEEASPRAKANLMRGILTGELDVATIGAEEFKAVADLCVNCHMCRTECPAGVDIPRLMMEGKGEFVATNGLSMSDWAMARVDLLSWAGQLFHSLGNWAIGNGFARLLLDRMFGISQSRKLPRFARRSFMRMAARRKLTKPSRRIGGKVLYFVDTYVNFHDPKLGVALVSVLEHNGISVFVHPDQMTSGMPMFALGDLARARTVARHNVSLLAEAVRQGYTIIATEPSAVMCLKNEYAALLGDDDSKLVAQHTVEASAFLWQLHRGGKLRLDLKPVNVQLGYHRPCHLRVLDESSSSENLLRLIPGLVVQPIEKGCSGMAGTFGLQRKNFRSSLRAGRGLVQSLRNPNLQAGVTECSACKIQMEQGAAKPTIHPIKLLALAYGLMPEAAEMLSMRVEEMYVT